MVYEEKGNLNMSVEDGDIERALFNIRAWKAPRSDGFPATFFQIYGALFGSNIWFLVKNSMDRGQMPNGLNDTLIYVIPKVDCPQSVAHFKPISLCNTPQNI